MIVIQLANTTLILGGRPIFTDLTWSIQHDQKIGLIGPNGAGKSSLFKLMVGEYTPEPGGNLIKAKGVTLGYLPQEPQLPLEQTVLATALSGNPRWHAVQAELERIETSLASPQVYNNPRVLARTLEEQQKRLEEYFILGGDTYPERVREILSGLGLAQEDYDKPIGVLSGGQKKFPCTSSQPCALRKPSWASVSTPSATTRSPRLRPSETIARVIAVSSALVGMPRTNERSIFSLSIGNRLR